MSSSSAGAFGLPAGGAGEAGPPEAAAGVLEPGEDVIEPAIASEEPERGADASGADRSRQSRE
eukprot:6355751-Alexandrium_andersonii.AAC.1